MHPVFNPLVPYGYLLPNMYLFLADITNPDLFVCVCLSDLNFLDITHFYDEQCQLSSGKSGSHILRRKGSTQFAQQFVSAVTAPPLVGGRPQAGRSDSPTNNGQRSE